jgi:hypothetical protein
MIKFFRRIRQNLLNEGKTSKYFKYAIGEIVLVVVGILIALWLNNLREKSENLKSECFYLTNLLDNLNEDKKEISFIQSQQSSRVAIRNSFFRLLENTDFDKKSISKSYTQVTEFNLTFFADPSAFNSLKSSGNLGLIQNKNLQLKLSNLYEKVYYRIDYNGRLYDQRIEMTSTKLIPYFDYSTKEFTNLDIIKHNQLRNIVAFEQDYNVFYTSLLEKAIIKIEELQEIILKEKERCD